MGVLQKYGVPIDGSWQTLMPKLQYRFRVLFGNLGGLVGNHEILTRQVISVTRPQLTHEEMILDVYNSRIYLAGKHTWNPITVILRDDVKSEVIKNIDKQLQIQLNHYDQSAAKSGANYKFGMSIETLQGDEGGPAAEPTVLDHWGLYGCYISDIQYGDSNYATSDQQQLTMTIRYDNATHGEGAGSIAGTGTDEFLHSDGPGHNKDVDAATGTNTG